MTIINTQKSKGEGENIFLKKYNMNYIALSLLKKNVECLALALAEAVDYFALTCIWG